MILNHTTKTYCMRRRSCYVSRESWWKGQKLGLTFSCARLWTTPEPSRSSYSLRVVFEGEGRGWGNNVMVEQRAGARGKEVLSWLWIGRTHPSLSVRLAGLPSRKTPSGLCGFYRVWWEGRGWGEANGGAGGGVTECSLVSAANELNQNQLAIILLE